MITKNSYALSSMFQIPFHSRTVSAPLLRNLFGMASSRVLSGRSSHIRNASTLPIPRERPEELLDFRPEKYRMINVMPRPPITLYSGPEERITTNDIFGGEKRVVVFSIPSPFQDQRLGTAKDFISERFPNFLDSVANVFEREVDTVVCITMNDPYVQKRWREDLHLPSSIKMLTDYDGDFTRHIGMDVDLSAVGQGIHSRRYNMIVDKGRVMFFNVEDSVNVIQRTNSVILLEQLDVLRRDVKKRKFASTDWTHDSLKQELMNGKFGESLAKDSDLRREEEKETSSY